MAFEKGYRRGYLWQDTLTAGELIADSDFNVSGKGEREFEIQISDRLKNAKRDLNHNIYSQYHNDSNVASAYFFGKMHRPDLSIDQYGTAIELKYIDKDLNGLKTALGQSMVYRLQFKFGINIFVISKENQKLYESAYLGHEPHMDGILGNMAEDMNVFSIIKPAFKPSQGLGHSISFFPDQ